MPDTKLSALTAGTVLAAGDLFVAVDISDTTMAASGTDKKWTVATILNDPVFAVGASGAGAPGGSGANGQWYYDTTNFRTYRSDGTGWVILSEPPVTSALAFAGGVTVGNGVASGSYTRCDGWLNYAGKFVFGTTSAVAGSVSVTLPIATSGLFANQLQVAFLDASAGTNFPGIHSDAATPTIYSHFVVGSNIVQGTLSSTIPFTWATSDTIYVSGRYRMTTRYS